VEFINNLRKKPEKDRKRILWSILIIIGLILLILWIYNSFKAINKLKEENLMRGLDIATLEEDMPEFDMPEIPEDEQLTEEELEEILKNATQ